MSVTIGVAPGGVGARLHIPALAGRRRVIVRPVPLPRIDPRRPEVLPGANVELDGLDLFIVGTPPYCHLRHSELLLRAGVPVICEKPAGLDAAQALRIAAQASRVNTECRVNFQLRFHPVVRQARQVARTWIPDEIDITCTSSARRDKSGKPAWYWQQASGGGVWFSLLPHLIDLAYFLGAQPQTLAVTRAVPASGPDSGIDALTVRARCRDKRNLTLTADPLAATSGLTIRFRNASGSEGLFDLTATGSNPWLTAFMACADTMLSGTSPPDLSECATLHAAVRTHQVIRTIRYASLAEGVWTEIAFLEMSPDSA